MDITVEVMLPPRGARDFSESAHPKWRVLAPVAVYYPAKKSQEIGMERTGYIHVTDVPEIVGADRVRGISGAFAFRENEAVAGHLNAKLCPPLELVSAIFEARTVVTVEKRQWIADPAQLSARDAAALLETRQITLTWDQFKQLMSNADDERPLVDAEIYTPIMAAVAGTPRDDRVDTVGEALSGDSSEIR